MGKIKGWTKTERYDTITYNHKEMRDGRLMNTGARVIISRYDYSPIDKWQVTINNGGYEVGTLFFPTKEKAMKKAISYMKSHPRG